jgi:hypothetical protein
MPIIIQREHWVHIKLPSRERVLVSVARSGAKIIQLKLGGMVPWRTIWQWARHDTAAMDRAVFDLLMTAAPRAGSLASRIAAIIERDCRSIDDIRARFPAPKVSIVDGVEYLEIDLSRPGVDFHIAPSMPQPRLPRDDPGDTAPSTDTRTFEEVLEQLYKERSEEEQRTKGEKP